MAVWRAAGLGPHHADGLDGRTDEHQARVLAGGGEIGVLAEEAVAGMDGLGAMFRRGVKHAVN